MGMTNPGITNLVSWWALEENGGTAYDSHGTNHLTENSGTIPSTTGKVNYGRDFEVGDTESLILADNASLSMGTEQSVTFGFWCTLESSVARARTITKWDGTASEYLLSFESLKPAFRGGGINFNTGAALSTGTWYFVLMWYDAVGNTAYISVNNGGAYSQGGVAGIPDSNGNFQIGGGSAGEWFDGVLDEVFIYKRVLTDDERSWLYNSGIGRRYADLYEKNNQPVFLSTYGVM